MADARPELDRVGKETDMNLRLVSGCLFRWHVQSKEISQPRAVFAFSFTSNGQHPNLTNQDVALHTEKIARSRSLPIIAQMEVADCLKDVPVAFAVGPYYRGTWKGPNTRDVAEAMASYFDQHNIPQRVIIVTHPLHMWRTVRVLELLGFCVGVPQLRALRFDRQSTLWWARGPVRFTTREIGARIYFLYKGWI